MRKLLGPILFASLCLLWSLQGEAARCFSTTCGTGTTDVIVASGTITPTTKFSISFWVNPNTTTAASAPRLIAVQNGSTEDVVVLWAQTPSNLLSITVIWSTTTGVWTAPILSTGAWHHVLISYDGSSTSNVPVIYEDCVAQTVTTQTAPVGSISYNRADTVNFGNRTAHDRISDGSLADIAIWGNNQILSANDDKALCRGMSPANIRYSSLLLYAPLFGGTTNDIDWGPSHYTETVTGAKFHTHAPVNVFAP